MSPVISAQRLACSLFKPAETCSNVRGWERKREAAASRPAQRGERPGRHMPPSSLPTPASLCSIAAHHAQRHGRGARGARSRAGSRLPPLHLVWRRQRAACARSQCGGFQGRLHGLHRAVVRSPGGRSLLLQPAWCPAVLASRRQGDATMRRTPACSPAFPPLTARRRPPLLSLDLQGPAVSRAAPRGL